MIGFFEGYLPPEKRVKQPTLDHLVNQTHRYLNTSRLRRDLPRRDRTDIAEELFNFIPEQLLNGLDANCARFPYCAHVALMVIEKWAERFKDIEELRLKYCVGTPSYDINYGDARLRSIKEMFGVVNVDMTLKWLSRELHARGCCYGTLGIYPREYFLSLMATTRHHFKLEIAPPNNWEQIAVCLMQSNVLQVVGVHEAYGNKYPVYKIVNGPDPGMTRSGRTKARK